MHCFSLVIFRFYSNNAIYLASLSFALFIFLLNCFWYQRLLLFRVKCQPGIAYKSVAYKKCSILNLKKQLSLMHLFLCLSPISWGRYVLYRIASHNKDLTFVWRTVSVESLKNSPNLWKLDVEFTCRLDFIFNAKENLLLNRTIIL